MTVLLNGEKRELQEAMTLQALLSDLQQSLAGVAVAVNMECVPRSQHADRVLEDGDEIEIVSAQVGG